MPFLFHAILSADFQKSLGIPETSFSSMSREGKQALVQQYLASIADIGEDEKASYWVDRLKKQPGRRMLVWFGLVFVCFCLFLHFSYVCVMFIFICELLLLSLCFICVFTHLQTRRA
jgi:hypothetical protein